MHMKLNHNYIRLLFFAIAFSIANVTVNVALAQTNAVPIPISADPMSTSGLLRTVLSLVIVCALAIIILKKFAPYLSNCNLSSTLRTKYGEKRCVVLERLVLDQRNTLAIIEVKSSDGLSFANLLISYGERGVQVHGSVPELADKKLVLETYSQESDKSQ